MTAAPLRLTRRLTGLEISGADLITGGAAAPKVVRVARVPRGVFGLTQHLRLQPAGTKASLADALDRMRAALQERN